MKRSLLSASDATLSSTLNYSVATEEDDADMKVELILILSAAMNLA